MIPVRGQVYWATVDGLRKPWLVISNNARNRSLPTCLGVRITTSRKPEIATIVTLGQEDAPLTGRVLCDDIAVLYPDDDAFEYLTSLSATTLLRVEVGLKAALAIR